MLSEECKNTLLKKKNPQIPDGYNPWEGIWIQSYCITNVHGEHIPYDMYGYASAYISIKIWRTDMVPPDYCTNADAHC